jgi:hypothetical protein
MLARPSFRRRAGSLTVALGAALLVSGCSLTTEQDTTPRLTMTFQVTGVQPEPGAAGQIEVSGGTRFIQGLGGVFVAPCVAANRNYRLDRGDGTLTVRVMFSPNNAACANGPTAVYNYNLYLTNIQEGTYTLRIIHEGDAAVPTGTVVKELTVGVASL